MRTWMAGLLCEQAEQLAALASPATAPAIQLPPPPATPPAMCHLQTLLNTTSTALVEGVCPSTTCLNVA